MKKFNLMKEYENAKRYILDVCDYKIEVVVACYKIYEAMMKLHPKANGKLIEKDFVIGRFLKYIAKNYNKQETKILYDYYFENQSYNDVANKYKTTSYEVSKSLKNTIWNLNRVNTTNNWFVMSQRKSWIEKHLKEFVKQEFKYKKTKAITEWETIEDMGLSKAQQVILEKHNINTLKELLEAKETYLLRILGQASYNAIKEKIALANSVL